MVVSGLVWGWGVESSWVFSGVISLSLVWALYIPGWMLMTPLVYLLAN
jgi:hypothetical protein